MTHTQASHPVQFEAVLFDLLTAVLDSWTLWNTVAGDVATGRRWREEYLQLTYAAGAYSPYESLVAEAATRQGLDPALAATLAENWQDLQPWPEAPAVLGELDASTRIGVVTNCSEHLGHLAAAQVGVPFEVITTAEAAGAYKPRPEPYQHALGPATTFPAPGMSACRCGGTTASVCPVSTQRPRWPNTPHCPRCWGSSPIRHSPRTNHTRPCTSVRRPQFSRKGPP